jgi:hypothetical protein
MPAKLSRLTFQANKPYVIRRVSNSQPSDFEVVHCFKVHSIYVTCSKFFRPKKSNRHQKKTIFPTLKLFFKSTQKVMDLSNLIFSQKKIYGKPQGRAPPASGVNPTKICFSLFSYFCC